MEEWSKKMSAPPGGEDYIFVNITYEKLLHKVKATK